MRTTFPTGRDALAAAALAAVFSALAPGCAGAADDAPPPEAVDRTADPLNILRLFDCTLYAADATIAMGPAVPQAIRISTGTGPWGAAYPEVTCLSYMVDITVPSTSSGGSGYLPSFRFDSFANELIPDEVTCEAYVQSTAVYLANQGVLSQPPIARAAYRGQWSGGACSPVQTSGDTIGQERFPPGSGSDLYRVATSGNVNGVYLQMYVLAQHIAHP